MLKLFNAPLRLNCMNELYEQFLFHEIENERYFSFCFCFHQVLYADSLSDVAQHIRQIADNSAKTTKSWHQADWHTRPWLTNTVSKVGKTIQPRLQRAGTKQIGILDHGLPIQSAR